MVALDRVRFYRNLGEVIAKEREQKGMTQADLAELVGLARSTVANIETGRRRLYVHQAHALAKALKVDPVVICGVRA